jgi:hypothetical protein
MFAPAPSRPQRISQTRFRQRAVEPHPRWTFHFTPTSCSWLNAVETFFAKLSRRRLKRGSFPSLVALQEAINRFVEEHNKRPKPFVWTADPDAIVEKVRRGFHALARRQAG